jgi:ABC-2 type transport system permease protein
MTALTLPPLTTRESVTGRARWAVKNTLVLTRRSIARIAREPEQLLDVTIQPVIFVLLFTYVFGSAIVLPGGGNYHEYLIGGMFGMSMAGTAPGTAVGISTDMKSGLIDRFRSLPISRSAVLAGRVLSDLCTQVLGVTVLVVTGLAVGWGIHNGLPDALAAIGLSLLIAFAMTWAGACARMLLVNPEAA